MLDRGDIVFVDLFGSAGREQAGPRPAIVLTEAGYHETSNTAVIVPVTSNLGTWPWKVILPPDGPIAGAVLCDQIRTLDRSSRGFRRIGKIDAVSMERVTSLVAKLLTGTDVAQNQPG